MPKGIKGFQKGHPSFTIKGRFEKGNAPWNKGKKNTNTPEQVAAFIARLNARKGIKFTEEHKAKISAARKGKPQPQRCGANHHNWKGGITSEYIKERNSLNFKIWRKAVFERDKYTCQDCGDNKGHNLNAHHIKPFAFYIDLRFEITNGITLCEKCHKKTDTYGGKKLVVEV